MHRSTAIFVLVVATIAAALPPGWAQAPGKPNTPPLLTNGRVPTFQELRAAAEKGDAEAQFTLGGMYYKGEGAPQDYNEAAKWYIKASEQGLWKAQFNLGAMYEDGLGVPQNYKKAVEWFNKAAEQNDPGAQFTLGLIYHNGEGIPRDYKSAIKWFVVRQGRRARRRGCAIQSWLNVRSGPRHSAGLQGNREVACQSRRAGRPPGSLQSRLDL
jgi:hypothetical protein